MWYIALLANTCSCLKSVLFRNLSQVAGCCFFRSISKFVQKDIVVVYPQLSTTWDWSIEARHFGTVGRISWLSLLVMFIMTLPPRTTWQCQIDSTTKGNKLIFEGLEFLFFFHYGRKRAECLAATSCCVPCHCIHPSNCLGNRTKRCESKRGRTQRTEDVNASDSVQIPNWQSLCFRTPNNSKQFI